MKGSRDFWRGNRLEPVEAKEESDHNHIFKYTKDGVECRTCRIGWIGKEFEVRDGLLYVNNKQIEV